MSTLCFIKFKKCFGLIALIGLVSCGPMNGRVGDRPGKKPVATNEYSSQNKNFSVFVRIKSEISINSDGTVSETKIKKATLGTDVYNLHVIAADGTALPRAQVKVSLRKKSDSTETEPKQEWPAIDDSLLRVEVKILEPGRYELVVRTAAGKAGTTGSSADAPSSGDGTPAPSSSSQSSESAASGDECDVPISL